MTIKKLKVAPAIYLGNKCSFPEYCISEEMYESEKQAKYELGRRLIKWLGGTSYEVEIEVNMDALKEIGKDFGVY